MSLLYNEEEARQLFYLTVEHVSGWNRSQLLMNKDHTLEQAMLNIYENTLAALKEGKPLQYIFSEAWFYGLKFKVSGSVLIPRPETEELVEWILEDIATTDIPVSSLIDIGTGSGCIAIALKKNLPQAEVSALDVSAEALAVAAENAVLNDTGINFIQSSIIGYHTVVKYDIIVSNPPYITEDERAAMHENVLQYEPHLALFVTNENPLIFYKSIADFALEQLRTGGKLFFEINEYLGTETVDMLIGKGFNNIELKKDMQGKERMIRCIL
jgi:release factor glutamine methyltransferase